MRVLCCIPMLLALNGVTLHHGAEAVKPGRGRNVPNKPQASTKAQPQKPQVTTAAEGSCPAPVETSSPPVSEPPKPQQSQPEPTVAKKGGGLTIQLRTNEEQQRQLTFAASTSPSSLRHHLLAQGLVSATDADALVVQRFEPKRTSQPLTSLASLRDGDVVVVASSSSGRGASSGAGVAASVRVRTSGGGKFVPYPEFVWKGAAQSSAARKIKSFNDIDLYKVTPQNNASVSLLRVDTSALEAFGARLAADKESHAHTHITDTDGRKGGKKERGRSGAGKERGSGASGVPMRRVALLFGTYNNKTREVTAHALFEPPQQAPSEAVPYNSWVLLGQEAAKAVKVASMLGLDPIGWVVSHGPRSFALSGQDVVTAAKLQANAMAGLAGRDIGGSFVTLAVNATNAPHITVEAFQVSRQGVQMAADGLLDSSNPCALQADTILTKSEVFALGQGSQELNTALLTVAVGIKAHKGLLKQAGGPVTDEPGVRRALAPDGRLPDPRSLLQRLSDFHLLVYLSRYLRTEEAQRLCTAVRALSEQAGGKGGKKKKGSAGGATKKSALPSSLSVPPGVMTMLEALCDVDDAEVSDADR